MNSELLHLKNTVKIIERQDKDQEKRFTTHISEKRLVSRTYEELSKVDNKTTKLKK